MAINEIGPAHEYQALREELQIAKKYVFERPVLIVGLGLASLRLADPQHWTLPVIVTIVSGLLLFNFWFTANRLQSAARIAAYVQLELEERSHGDWVGWETCLREYRIWLNVNKDRKRAQIDEELKSAAVSAAIPDALMYYPPIYGLHIGLMALAVTTSFVVLIQNPTSLSIVCVALTSVTGLWFSRYLKRYRPKTMKTLVERNRIIWREVFNRMGAKSKSQT